MVSHIDDFSHTQYLNQNNSGHLDIGEGEGAPGRLMWQDEEDKLHEGDEEREKVEKSKVEPFPAWSQPPVYICQLPKI